MTKIFKLLKSNWFWGFFATCLILFSFTVFSTWVGIAVIWFGLFFIFRFTQLEAKLSLQEQRIYDIMMNIIGGFVGFAILKWKA